MMMVVGRSVGRMMRMRNGGEFQLGRKGAYLSSCDYDDEEEKDTLDGDTIDKPVGKQDAYHIGATTGWMSS